MSETRERYLVRIQAISGLVFATFLSLHLTNVMASVFGPGLYDAFQVRIRPLYQFPLVEVGVLLTALVVHIVSGVRRLRARPRTRDWSKLPFRTRLHRVSAYFLLLFIFGHIAATRFPSLLDGIWLGFASLAYTMVWIPAFFYPYYSLLALCGLYHGGYGSYLALRVLGVPLPSISRARARIFVPLSIAAVLLVAGVLSFGGLLYPIADPQHDDYARFLAERFGVGG